MKIKRSCLAACFTLLLCTTGFAQERPELVLQKAHTGDADIVAVASLPSREKMITIGTDGAIKVWDSEKNLVLKTIYDTEAFPNPEELGGLKAATISPNSDWAVTVDSAGSFRRFSVPDGKLLARFEDPLFDFGSRAFQTDGTHLYYFRDGALIKSDLGGKVLAELAVRDEADSNATFALSPDFTKLALKTKNGVGIFSSQSLKNLATKPLNSVVEGFSFSPDSTQLALSTNSAVALLGTDSLDVKTVLEHQDDVGHTPIWSGSELYFYPQDGSGGVSELYQFDFAKGSLKLLGGSPASYSARVSSDGEILVGSFGGTAWRWRPNEQEKTELASDIGGYPAYTIDETTGDLLTGGRGGEVVRWSSKTGRQIKQYSGHKAYMSSLDVSPDGSKVIGSDVSDGDVICWDAKTGKELSRVKLGRGRFGSGVKFAEFVDSERYVVSTFDRVRHKISLRQASDGKEINGWSTGSTPTTFALSPDGKRIVIGLHRGFIEADLVRNRDRLRVGIPQRATIKSVCYGPNGQDVFGGTEAGHLYHWDSSNAVARPSLLANFGRGVEIVSLEHTGSQLEAILRDGRVLKLSLTGEELSSQKLAESNLYSPLKFGKNTLLAPGPNDSLVFLNIDSGEKLGRLAGVRDNSGWVFMNRAGSFDGNDVGLETINFELDGQFFGLSQFVNQYFRPGSLAELLPSAEKTKIGTRTTPELTARSVKKPPKVEILEPRSGTILEDDQVQVKVKVTAQGGGAAGVSLFHNGHKLPSRQQRALTEDTYVFTVRPVKGKNEFRASAFDSSKSVEARQDRVRVLAPNIEARPPKLHLLSVGVDEYTSGLSLKFAEDDAESVTKLFNSKLYGEGERKLLSNEEATLAGIKQAIESIAATAEPQDAFVFYLAGHGTVIGEDYYFLPHDVDIASDASLSSTALSSEGLGEALKSVPATKQLLILDSCRSGAAVGVVGRYFAARSGLEEIRSQQLLARSSGTFLIAATKAEEYAYEIPQLGHGVLTYALLESLGLTEGSTTEVKTLDGITANELLQSVSIKVPKLSEKYQGVRQQVIQYSSGQDFPLAK